MSATQNSSSKFVLDDLERYIFMQKVLPISFWGCVVWFLGEIFFGLLFSISELLDFFWLIYFLMWIVVPIIFGISFYAAKRGDNNLSMMTFFVFCYCAGILAVPILLWSGSLYVFIYGAISIGFGGVAIVYLTGLILKDRFFAEKSFWVNFGLIIGLFALLEISTILIFGITSFFTITLSLIVMGYIVILTAVYGPALAKQIKEDYWMYWTLRILGTLILTIIGIILLIVIILLMIASDGGDIGTIDLPIGGGGSSTKKPKRIHEKTSHYEKRISKKK